MAGVKSPFFDWAYLQNRPQIALLHSGQWQSQYLTGYCLHIIVQDLLEPEVVYHAVPILQRLQHRVWPSIAASMTNGLQWSFPFGKVSLSSLQFSRSCLLKKEA